MIKFVCLFLLLFYYCCHGYPITGEIPDDTDIALLIENLINHYNNISSTTDELQQSLNLSTEIQNAPDIVHQLEYLINQSSSTDNHSKALEDLKTLMFSNIGVRGGKGGGSKGGGSKVGGGSKTKVGGGGSRTRIGGRNYYRPRSGGSGGGGGAMTALWVVVGISGFAVLTCVGIGLIQYCSEKNDESRIT